MLQAVRRRSVLARLVDAAIALAALTAFGLSALGALAPRLSVRIDPAAVSSDGGHAYIFSPGFVVHWPYVAPSHPDFTLSPGDVRVTERGRPIGALQPSHDLIREQGGGFYNLWQGTLWFSPVDDADPRTNGRTYEVEVQTRLEPLLAATRAWSLAALSALLAGRLSPLAIRALARSRAALEHRLGIGRLPGRIPLTFGRTFALAAVAVLAGFAWGRLAHPMPFVLEADSLGYIRPGLVWASGGDITGQSARDLGYPWLTLLAVRLGSLSSLGRLQLLSVIAGSGCTLGVLYLVAAALKRRLVRQAGVPAAVLALAAAGTAVFYVALLSAHDLFVLDLDSAMAEAPHFFPTALALLLFVAGCITSAARIRLVALTLASLAAYASVMVKPNALLVLALCLLGLTVAGMLHRRSLLSPLVIAVSLTVAVSAAFLHRLDARMTPVGNDFGPKTLFCNHLDVIAPVFATSTPERLRIQSLSQEVLSRVAGWPVMGFDGDGCMYGAAFDSALVAVSRSEGSTPGQWELREFVKAVLRNPIGYARVVFRQTRAYLTNSMNGMDAAVRGSLTEDDCKSLEPFAVTIGMCPRSSDAISHNWMPTAFPRFGAVMKEALRVIADLFAPVTLGSTGLALVALVRFRRNADLRPEIVVVATALFVSAFVGTTVLSHTFDIARYSTDLLPFSLLWWIIGVAYLAHVPILVVIAAHRAMQGGRISQKIRATSELAEAMSADGSVE